MSVAEIYTGVQTHVIDGGAQDYIAIYEHKYMSRKVPLGNEPWHERSGADRKRRCVACVAAEPSGDLRRNFNAQAVAAATT